MLPHLRGVDHAATAKQLAAMLGKGGRAGPGWCRVEQDQLHALAVSGRVAHAAGRGVGRVVSTVVVV